MDELIELVVKKTGISEPQARQAVEVVVEFIKDKLPDPIAGHVDNVLEGGGLAGALGGLLGGND